MRIDDIEVISLRFEYPPGKGFRYAGGTATGRLTTLVRVHATDGKIGLGSAYTHPELARVVIEDQLAPSLRGHEVTDPASTWHAMMRLVRWYGRAGAAVTALGAVDTALWDLLAQQAGQPLWRFLGGSRASVPAYASGLLWQDDLGRLRDEARRHLAGGFTRMKMRLGRCRDYDEAAYLAVTDAVAGRGQVLVDGSLRFTAADASWLARILADHGAGWFEEPFEPDDVDGYRALRANAGVPLAAGENETSPRGLAGLIRAGAVDVAQPDASRVGGVTGVLHVAGVAAGAGIRVATHTWSDAVAIMVNAHVVASIPHGMTIEIDRTGNVFVDDLLTEPLRIHEGLLHLPERPGLGIRLDESVIARHRLAPGRIPDGNYSDMLFGALPGQTADPYDTHWREAPPGAEGPNGA